MPDASMSSAWSRARPWATAFAGAILIAAIVAAWLSRTAVSPSLLIEPVSEGADAPLEAGSVDGERVAVDAAELAPPAAQVEAARARSFDEIFDEIVALWRRGVVGEGGDDGGDLARETSELVTELLVTFPDAGERALLRVAEMPTPWGAAPDELVAARVGRVVIDFALQRMAGESRSQAQLPRLVDNLLDSMPMASEMATFVADILADRPYLEARHEGILIELARSATGSLEFLVDPVRRLLLTVWANIQRATGEPASADLLTWFADPHGGLVREAAMQRLLSSERYRSLVIDQLIADGDLDSMQNAAMFAATELPVNAALSTLSALQSGNAHVNLIGAYAWMSAANGDSLRRDYEECLADGITPRHREALIAALGNVADAAIGHASARTAFDMDPDPRVRGVAFLALCNGAPAQVVADCLNVAMADREFAAHYDLHYMVTGVGALCRREDRDVNLLDLATTFLLSQAALASWDRQQLETLRREYLPR